MKQALIRYWNAPSLNLSYLGMPKAGSSSVRAAIGAHPENDWTLEPTEKTTFTVLRHPVARTVSAYVETLRRKTHWGTFSEFLRRLQDVGWFDEHTIPQADYFRPVDRVFILEAGDVWDWIGVDREPRENRTTWRDGKKPVPTSEEIRIIRKLYSHDFELYRKYGGSTKISTS